MLASDNMCGVRSATFRKQVLKTKQKVLLQSMAMRLLHGINRLVRRFKKEKTTTKRCYVTAHGDTKAAWQSG